MEPIEYDREIYLQNDVRWIKYSQRGDTFMTRWGALNSDSVQESTKTLAPNKRKSGEDRATIAMDAKILVKQRSGYQIPGHEVELDYHLVCRLTNLKGLFKKLRPHMPMAALLKLNGLNGRWDGGRLMSRGNVEFKHLETLRKMFSILESAGWPVQGLCFELYVPGYTLEEISEICADPKREHLVHAYIFDQMGDLPFLDRYSAIGKMVNQMEHAGVDMSLLHLLGLEIVHTPGDAELFYHNIMDGENTGHHAEGVVFRSLHAAYMYGTRSSRDFKEKPTVSREVMVVDCICDRAKDGTKVASFICEINAVNAKGEPLGRREFKVIPSMSTAERSRLWGLFVEGLWNPTGKDLTLEFYEFTKYGIPKHIKETTFRVEDMHGPSNEA